MKRDRNIFRITTGIIVLVMVYSIISFTFMDHVMYPDGAFQHLHLPNYIRVELTIAKILGVCALLIPSIPFKLKEFAYVGFGITLISAAIAHSSVGDPWYNIIDPLVFLGILIVSYSYFIKLQRSGRQPRENPPYSPAKQAQ